MSRSERYFLLCILVLASCSLFINLGVAPLRHEEPRRAFIALEMLFRENWIVPTQMGELYYNKPPLYNWILISAFSLFGNFSEFAVRFVSVVSLIIIVFLIFWVGKRYLSLTFAVYSALFFLVSADIYYYISLTGEIDLFYSLITFGSFITVFHFFQQKGWYALFLLTYLLTALGTLTKGLPSVIFTGITLLSYFASQRSLKKLFSLPHLLGIALFILIVGGYFLAYSNFENVSVFLQTLYSESSRRTAAENSWNVLVSHLLTFPLETVMNTAPTSLLLLFMIRRNFRTEIIKHPLILFAAVTFTSNMLVYWLSPGARSRYVYSLYPFLIMLFVYGYMTIKAKPVNHWRFAIFRYSVNTLIILVGLACFTLPFLEILQPYSGISVVSSVGVVVCIGFFVFYRKLPTQGATFLIALAVLIRWIFNFTVIPYRAAESSEAQDKRDAQKVAEIVENQPLSVMEGSDLSKTTIFYLEKERKSILPFSSEPKTGVYYIVFSDSLTDVSYQSFYHFKYQHYALELIQFQELASPTDVNRE